MESPHVSHNTPEGTPAQNNIERAGTMLPELLQKARLFHLLYRIDESLLKEEQSKSCKYCNGPLYQANYMRKPRGGPENIPDNYLIRFSLCCGNECCRKRNLPPSCRFMGRRVYWGAVILVVMTLRQNRENSASAGKLERMFGISRNTLKSWFQYFREEFPVSERWHRIRGLISATVKNSELPGALFRFFNRSSDNIEKALIRCLQFLSTGKSVFTVKKAHFSIRAEDL